jgi:hypothetical protein
VTLLNYLLNLKRITTAVAVALAFLFSYSLQAQDIISNSPPTLDPVANDTTIQSSDIRYIELNGITPGQETDQQVQITVSTQDSDIVQSIGADLVDNGKAFINYQLKESATGTATVKVVITDNGPTPSSFTRIFHITIEKPERDLTTTSVPEETVVEQMKAVPNPALLSTRLFFSTPQDEKLAVLDLYTLSGAKVLQLYAGNTLANRPYSVDVNVRNLATGVYIVRLTGQSQTSNLKLVVAK